MQAFSNDSVQQEFGDTSVGDGQTSNLKRSFTDDKYNKTQLIGDKDNFSQAAQNKKT